MKSGARPSLGIDVAIPSVGIVYLFVIFLRWGVRVASAFSSPLRVCRARKAYSRGTQ